MTVKIAHVHLPRSPEANRAKVQSAKKMHALLSRIEILQLVNKLRRKNEGGVVEAPLLPELLLGVVGHTSDNQRDRLAKWAAILKGEPEIRHIARCKCSNQENLFKPTMLGA